LTQLVRIRRFEQRCIDLEGKIPGFVPVRLGEDAIAVGVAQALRSADRVVTRSRHHAYALARGLAMNELMAELFGRVAGFCRGRGGTGHLYSADRYFYSDQTFATGGLPMAAGLALADTLQNRQRVTVCFFNATAGAVGNGFDSLNMARSLSLPLLGVCEQRLGRRRNEPPDATVKKTQVQTRLAEQLRAWAAVEVDSLDVLAVEAAAVFAYDAIRRGHGPQLLIYDSPAEGSKRARSDWPDQGAIERLSQWLRGNDQLTDAAGSAIEATLDWEFKSAVQFASASAIETLDAFVWRRSRVPPWR
jgi:TPP-dependent pyruvate/acetoin dehydrogenase alpha subunit